MFYLKSLRRAWVAGALLLGGLSGATAGNYADSFGTSANYLTNGVAGKIWDGVYFGAGEFANTGTGGGGAGSTLVCDANLTAASTLTLQTTGTAWENADDDGFFLYKVVPGDFSVSVQVVSPFTATAYNTAGLQARAFSAGGNPFGGSEDYVSWTRFDQFSIPNFLRSEVNGVVTAVNPGGYPNSNYWLRMDRVNGTNFYFYQKATSGAAWTAVTFPAPVSGTRLLRPDLAGVPMQVGIMHATFNNQLGVQFTAFTLNVSNVTETATPPAVTGLTATTNANGTIALSWTPGAGSGGTVVTVWKGSSVLKQSPANGISYTGNAAYGAGDTLPALNYYVAYAGNGSSVTVSNLAPGTTYYAAAFAYAGAGNTRTYSHVPSRTSFAPAFAPAGPLTLVAQVADGDLYLTIKNLQAGKWYRLQYTGDLPATNWQVLYPVAQPATGTEMTFVQASGALAAQRFFRAEQLDAPPAGMNLAPEATVGTSYISPWENLTALNDGFDPADSSDHTRGAYGNWPETVTAWVEYEWPLPITTSMVDVYWWSDGGGIMPPSACRLKYWDGANYVSVPNVSGLGVLLNQYNTTTFAPVTTTRLRLEFDAGAASTGLLEWRVYDAGISPTNWPGAPESSLFAVRASAGALTSLKRKSDAFVTEYIAGGGRLGDANLKYRQAGTNWIAANTATLASAGGGVFAWTTNQTDYISDYRITNGATAVLALQSAFNFQNDGAIVWTLNLTNLTGSALEIGDLALPFVMNTTFASPSSSVFRHHSIAGHGSFMFWMRPNCVGPYLVATPLDNTALEYWDALGGSGDDFEAYIHSAATGATTAAAGTKWRQTNTSLTLPAGGTQSYGLKFRWAADYDGVRDALVEEGKMDVHVVPGMTVPTNLVAQFALRTTQTVNSVTAEFPAATQIQSLGTNGGHRLYQVQFAKLGENKLTVNYGSNRYQVLEFFVTEPLETLFNKRTQFLVGKQVLNTNKWYNGLYPEWNMASQTLVTPDNYDLLVGFVRYEVAADDAGLSRPAYLAAKNALLPVQSEVTSLDYYIKNFVWGGLQRTTNETYAYGIYGVQDWYSNRTSSDPGTGGQLHIWRIYDYPHIVAMYYGMYEVAKHHPEIATLLTADEYLRRAYGTAVALFTVPNTVSGWSAYQTGLMNELVITDLIDDLTAEGLATEAATLRGHWEQKVNYFASGDRDLFGSEYAFDSTGFETLQALAKYALLHADTLGATNPAAYRQTARNFMDGQMAANIFCRGWLETSYYYYGSDYRSHAGNDYVLTYMSQMGGWGVLDYGLYYATNATDYLRLGYASYLSSWALMNTGTPDSNYGYWYPGAANDGGAGGGFEPSPANTTWLGQPAHRGSWYYACEQDLAYCGAVRMAATVLADDPIFGRFCYGGSWSNSPGGLAVIPQDGVRQRFHAMLATNQLHLVLDNDNFQASHPIVVSTNLSSVGFTIQTSNPLSHAARAHFTPATSGSYTVTGSAGVITNLNLTAGTEAVIDLPLAAATTTAPFTISK